jgi:hypothetical protein
MSGKDMNLEVSMKENYELNAPPRKNPYAERIKKHGYSVSIHYESPEDVETEAAVDTIKSLLKRTGVNSIHLYIKNNGSSIEEISYSETK